MFPNPLGIIQSIPKKQRVEKISELVASKIEGLDVAYVKKLIEFRAVSVLRWPAYCPETLPKDTKLWIFFADRARFGLKEPYYMSQGFDRFCEGGREQWDEHILPLAPKATEGPLTKYKGMGKLFEFHFRFMHNESIFAEIKKRCFDKIGMF